MDGVLETVAEDGKIHAQEIDLWSEGVEVLMKAKNVEAKRLKSLMDHGEQDEIMRDDFLKLLAEAVQDLRPFNGLEFSKYGTSEGRYIQAVVDEICEIIPPMMKYNIDGIRGYQRMCEKASSLFEEGSLTNDVCKPGCLYVGFYGMGGVGKTTLCGALCSFYQVEYHGRVCHVELQSDTKYERIERLKHVIRELGGCDDRVVEKIKGESQGLQCLKARLKSQPPAFLAVDNVGDSESSRDEARRFISCGLACGSRVMVTSRSRLILESVLREAKHCKPIPRLEEQEAEELFLSVAIPEKILSPLPADEAVIVKACVRDCKFLDDGYDVQQYHPLVLRALGTFFHDVDKNDILKWKKALMFKDKLQASRESKHVNNILGLNYTNLSDGQKLLFLDVVFLFNYAESFWSLERYLMGSFKDKYNWVISLIAAVHGISTFKAEFEVKELQRKSLIDESSPTLRTHDLYIEFARSMVGMEGSKEKEWWVGHRDANGYNSALKRLILVCDESKIGHPPKLLWECPILECLILCGCKIALESKLDLSCIPNLRVLMIVDFDKLTILCTSDDAMDRDLNIYGLKDQNKGCLPKLHMVQLWGFDVRRIPFLRHCWNLTFLSFLEVDFSTLDSPQAAISLFENLKSLETWILHYYVDGKLLNCLYDGILQCATKMKNLKHLEPSWTLTSLETLSLRYLPSFIKELVGLDQLSQLIELNLWYCGGLQKLPNLDLMPNLQWVCVHFCVDLGHLQDQLKRFQAFHPREGELH